MTLQEFLEKADDCDVEIYSNLQPHQQISIWYDNDPRYNCGILRFGIVSETCLWVEIDEEAH